MDQQCSRVQACVPHWNHMTVIWEPIALSVHIVLTVDHIWPLKACGRSLQQTSSHTHRHGISHTPTPYPVPSSLSGNISARIRSNYDLHNIPLSMHRPSPVREQHPAQLDWHPWLSYLGGCQSVSFCHLLFETFKELLLLRPKFKGCLFPCLSAFAVVRIKWQIEVWIGYCSWLNPESYVHVRHSLVFPPLILL